MDAPPIIRPRPKAVFSTNLPAKDIVFRLAVLAVLSVELFWYPVYYFTTYESGPDGREGFILFYAFWFCPASWILGPLWYAQVWRRGVVVRFRVAFRITCTLLLTVVLSTFVYLAYRILAWKLG